MNQRDHFSRNLLILTSVPKELSFLKYQMDYHISGSLRYAKSVTIIMGRRIIKRYNLKKMLLIDNSFSVDQIIVEAMFDGVDLSKNKDSARNGFQSAPKNDFDKQARNKAALNLFSDLGL